MKEAFQLAELRRETRNNLVLSPLTTKASEEGNFEATLSVHCVIPCDSK